MYSQFDSNIVFIIVGLRQRETAECSPYFFDPGRYPPISDILAVKVLGTNIGSDGTYKRIVDNYCNLRDGFKAFKHVKNDKILSFGSREGQCSGHLYITSNNSLPAKSK